jgi:hypothetical protein
MGWPTMSPMAKMCGTLVPPGNAANFSFEPAAVDVEGGGAVTIPEVSAAGVGAHGVSGAGAGTPDGLAAEGSGTHENPSVEGVGAVTIPALTAEGLAAHGVTAAGAVTIGSLAVDGAGAHGVAGAGAVTLDDLTVAGAAAHGVRGEADATIGALMAVGVASHPRYSLKGEVRDGGVLVNRTVRVYLRSTGALIGEQFTTAGRFDIHAGFAEAEHYILPIDLGEGATDWAPPAANRVLSVLAMDA